MASLETIWATLIRFRCTTRKHGDTPLAYRPGTWSAIVLFLLASLLGSEPARAAGESGLLKAQEGATALLKGNSEQALAAYTEALKDDTLPNDRRAGILNDRGVAYSRMGQFKLAIDDYNRAVQLFPEYAPIYNNRGSALLRLGLPQEAVRDFDRALVLAPGYAAAYSNRATAFLRLGQPAEAVNDFTQAIKLLPRSAAPLTGRGHALLVQGRPYAAIRDFNRALAADARFAAAYRGRAEAKLEVERFDEAIEDLSRAIAFEPAAGELYLQRGNAYLLAGNPAAAASDFSRALEIGPEGAPVLAKRALAYVKEQAFEEAETDLARALELDPRCVEAFAYRAYLYQKKEQPELALREIEKALKLNPANADVYWVKGELEQAAGRKEAAIANLRKALEIDASHAAAGEALRHLGAVSSATTVVAGAGLDEWRVVMQGNRYYGLLEGYPKLKVPLEMAGEGRPRILEWEVKKPPLKGIGVLRYYAGQVATKAGAEELEQAAVIDLTAGQVVTVQLQRQGAHTSTWTWDDSKVTIASIDGVTEEYVLRAKPKEQIAQRRPEPRDDAGPFWAPWNQQFWGSPAYAPRQQQARRQKPKTIFDLIFGN